MSVAETEKVTAAPDDPVASVVILPGTVIDGAVVSTTVMLNVAVPILVCASVAEQ